MADEDKCPKCGAPLGEVTETSTGRKLQRCSQGSWNPETRKTEGCSFVKWLPVEPQTLDEKCPKCGQPLVIAFTRFGKKMKKCSTNTWNPETKQAEGCDYVEWINGTTEELDEDCPTCGAKLVLYTSAKGKKMKKCSTSGWDKEKRQPTGCDYIEWLPSDYQEPTFDEQPPPPEEE
jgi:ssDNA-binding Zn-finger/Zn-ribbon topoisomerase 1